VLRRKVILSAGAIAAGIATVSLSPTAAKESDRLTPEHVLQFMQQFDEAASKKDFSLLSNMIHERASYRLNDGDFFGRDAVRSALEKTWQSAYKVDSERFYLSDIQVLSTDQASASVTYTYNWEWSLAGKQYRMQGRGTRVFVKENGSLQIMHTHLSTFPKG